MLLRALILSLASSVAALDRPRAAPLPATQPPEEGRVMFDSDSDSKEAPEAALPGRAGVKQQGLGRLVSVDVKERRVVLELEDGGEQSCLVPEAARLSFTADERPLHLDQLRRGDAVSYAVEGSKVVRLHLELGGEGGEDPYVAPPPRRRPPARHPPPPDESVPEYPVNEPDTPMYQSEPSGTEPAPAPAPTLKPPAPKK